EALRGTYHAFTVALVTPMNQVRCLEGQKACFFHPEEALKLRMHPTSRKILNRFLERKNGAQTST
ncbi:MAG: hypothetical protein GWN88_10165, partial [Nitrospinaceae bacterium]|nr:hypothetical protein [Nitrospinaceae bacterium]